jgi:lipoprotein-anchoring transpeptidase ErfK/SrfK
MSRIVMLAVLSFLLSSCTNSVYNHPASTGVAPAYSAIDFAARLPSHIDTANEKAVFVDPNVHAWGAYDSTGKLIRAGQASAGSNWCPDLGRPCHTHPGTYRVNSLGSPGCKSSQFPIPHGGAPMPYCMFFDRNQALHGSPDREVVDGNISHGCVRMHVPDAEWLRYNFVSVGTKVIVEPY